MMYPVMFATLFFTGICISGAESTTDDGPTCCLGLCPRWEAKPPIKPRRYDINDLGYVDHFHGWADVQGQGAANDYCRFIGVPENTRLSCALAGTHGDSDINYLSADKNFERGYVNTWYMRDEDGDGRDDYCRCMGTDPQQVVCTKAGPLGFYGSAAQGGNTLTFTPTGNTDCKNQRIRPEIGRVAARVLTEKPGTAGTTTEKPEEESEETPTEEIEELISKWTTTTTTTTRKPENHSKGHKHKDWKNY